MPVSELPRVGPKLKSLLEKIGITQIKDLLFHLPYRYEDKTRAVPLGSVVAGERVLIIGKIAAVSEKFSGRRALVADIRDATGSISMCLFHFNTRQRENLERANWIRCYGEARLGRYKLQMIHPEYTVFDRQPQPPDSDRLTPVYRRTEGITQYLMRTIVKSSLTVSQRRSLQELLPEQVRKANRLPDIHQALDYVHAPPVSDALFDTVDYNAPAMRRFIFEELVSFQIARMQQKKLRQSSSAESMHPQGDLSDRLKQSLPFEPTGSQIKVIREIIVDLKKDQPMLRLVQGDVGSGKTLVAAAAVAWVVDCKHQVAIMAPTELLAEQHLKTFTEWFLPLGIEVALLTGRLPAKQRRYVTHAARHGSAKIVIGTHALFQEGVEFKSLGLVVVDEQHRFGVGQRYALREKGISASKVPHQLVMTATPIPRTLAMTFYADLDVSSVTEMPPGRVPVQTAAMPASQRNRVLTMVRNLCATGQQAYWVCPIIDKSETIEAQAAVDAQQYVSDALEGYSVGLIHGRLKSTDRDRVMDSFRKGEIHVLVATTIIEVGVDVPNATLMVIESSDRLGLAQLHQLRGRVGRSSKQSRCVLMHKDDPSKIARERLSVMKESNDGFKISEIDLKLRGAGELLGTRQSGAQLFRIAELPRDMGLIGEVNQAAELILQQTADLAGPLIRRWTPKDGDYISV